jgi:uncharacterized repeat protein (TIGR03837 family)
MPIPIWILCKVVDNFGDAGVCWRLARSLAATGDFEPTLVIDQPATLAAIEPRLARQRGRVGQRAPEDTQIDGVRIIERASVECSPADGSPAVIVSAFGCEPPTWLRARLAGGPRRPLWLQLEYLSAEDWIEDCHGLVSTKPADAAREHFLYPGFTERSAGLIREPRLFEHRDEFRAAGGPAAAAMKQGPDRAVLLAEVASVFLNECRDIDVLGRFTTTTFLFLLPGTPPLGAQALARRLIQSLSDRSFAVPVRPACGVVSVPMAGISDRRQFLVVAEECLRRAVDEPSTGGVAVAWE